MKNSCYGLLTTSIFSNKEALEIQNIPFILTLTFTLTFEFSPLADGFIFSIPNSPVEKNVCFVQILYGLT